jgi:hypothetical protein
MGLTPSDMTQISNRLVALERERGFKADIAEAVADKTWTKVDKGWYLTPAGQEKLNKIGMIQL